MMRTHGRCPHAADWWRIHVMARWRTFTFLAALRADRIQIIFGSTCRNQAGIDDLTRQM